MHQISLWGGWGQGHSKVTPCDREWLEGSLIFHSQLLKGSPNLSRPSFAKWLGIPRYISIDMFLIWCHMIVSVWLWNPPNSTLLMIPPDFLASFTISYLASHKHILSQLRAAPLVSHYCLHGQCGMIHCLVTTGDNTLIMLSHLPPPPLVHDPNIYPPIAENSTILPSASPSHPFNKWVPYHLLHLYHALMGTISILYSDTSWLQDASIIKDTFTSHDPQWKKNLVYVNLATKGGEFLACVCHVVP